MVQMTIHTRLCQNPECATRFDARHHHVRIGDNYYCSNDCAIAWLEQAKRFERAADPHHHPMYGTKKWYDR